MNIQELLGEAYKDGMTIDDINAAMADKTFVDKSSTVSKKQFDDTASELSTAKKRVKELENASLTDGEKLQAAQKAAEEAKKEYLRKSTKLDVEKVLVDGGLKENDYKDIIDSLVSENADDSVNRAKSLIALLNSVKKETENSVKKDLQSSLESPPDSNHGNGDLSLDEINKIEDTTERQAKMAEYLERNNK